MQTEILMANGNYIVQDENVSLNEAREIVGGDVQVIKLKTFPTSYRKTGQLLINVGTIDGLDINEYPLNIWATLIAGYGIQGNAILVDGRRW